MSTSPYKKLKLTNKSWIGYISMSKLAPHKCHKMLCLSESNHHIYGKGQQTTIECPDGKRFRVQLPGKYLAKLSPEELSALKQDMVNEKYPYLIYRETMVDKSFRMDVVEKSSLSDQHFSNGTDFPELNDSLEEISETEVTNPKDGQNENSEGKSKTEIPQDERHNSKEEQNGNSGEKSKTFEDGGAKKHSEDE